MSEGPPSPKRPRLDLEDLNTLSREELIEKLREQDDVIYHVRQRGRLLDEGDEKENDDKLKQPSIESSRRENTLVLRLTNKEQELQDCMNQIAEMKAAQTQNSAQLRSLLLDPAVNLVFQRMAKELEDTKEKLKQTQNELSAWKFTPDSQMGKRLMAKCRMLLQENEDLGKMISSGRTAKLEAEIALQKTVVTEMKNNQDEMTEFVSDLEEDVEGMQSMIYVLQQQLKEAKEQLVNSEAENTRLRTLLSASQPEPGGGGVGGGSGCSKIPADSSSLGGIRCIPETTVKDNSSTCGGGDLVKQSAPFVEGSKVYTSEVSSSRAPCLNSAHTTNDSSVKRTNTGDNLEKNQHLANSRTSDVLENNQHKCSPSSTETTKLRTDQACEVTQTPFKKAHSIEILEEGGRDSKPKEDGLDIKICSPDLKPIKNGGLDEVTCSVNECDGM